MTARDQKHEDPEDNDGLQPANQGPIPAEPEDVSDTGEGRLAPQAGSDQVETEEDATER